MAKRDDKTKVGNKDIPDLEKDLKQEVKPPEPVIDSSPPGQTEVDTIPVEEVPGQTSPDGGPKPSPTGEVIDFPQPEPPPESEQTLQARRTFEQASEAEQTARHEVIKNKINYAIFKGRAPEIYEQERATLTAALQRAEDRLLSSPPVRASSLNGGSLGEMALGLVFNVASGGSYLKGLKSAYARAKAERTDAIQEYNTISKMYKSNSLGELQFQKDMLTNIKSMLEIEAATNPLNVEAHKKNMEKADLELELTRTKIAEIKDNSIKKDLDYGMKMKERAYKDKMRPFEERLKSAQTAKAESEALLSRYKATDILSGEEAKREKEAKKILEKRREIVPGVIAMAFDKPAKINEGIVKAGEYKNLAPVIDRVLKQSKTFSNQDLITLKGRFKTGIAGVAERFGKASKKEIEVIKKLKLFNTDLHSFFGGVKDMLKLGRLSDWDAMFIKKYLNLVDSDKVTTSLSFLTPSNLAKLQRAVESLDTSMKEEVRNKNVPMNKETGEYYTTDQFAEILRGGSSKKKKKAVPKKEPKTKTVRHGVMEFSPEDTKQLLDYLGGAQ